MKMALEKKEIKLRLKQAKSDMRESKKKITDGLNAVMKGESKDLAAIRSELAVFGKASVEAAKLQAKL